MFFRTFIMGREATEVSEGDNGETKTSSKQDISHTEAEGDHHLDNRLVPQTTLETGRKVIV